MTPKSKQKQEDASKKNKTLKRAGSPALSESSGNESTRKKLKKTSTNTPASRSGTPVPLAKPKALKKGGASRGAGSGSDGEMTAGEMSDGVVAKRKIKLVASRRASPAGSRAGSPIPAVSGGKWCCHSIFGSVRC